MAVHNRMVVREKEVFGRWVATSDGYSRKGKTYVDVLCSCGTRSSVRAVLLRNGKSKGCMACSGITKRIPRTVEELRAMNRASKRRYREKHLTEIRAKGRKMMRARRAARPEYYAEIARRGNRKSLGCVNPTGETKSGNCEICGLWWEQLHYDHDHATGLHRGWLCSWCNRQLGWYEKRKIQILAYLAKRVVSEKGSQESPVQRTNE